MKIKITYTKFNTKVERKVARIIRVTPIGLPQGITNEILTEEGQLIVCIEPGVAAVIDPPTANNQTLVSDLTVAGLWKIGTVASSGGVIELTNKDVVQALAGSLAIADLSNDKAFLGTTVPNHLGVIGVTKEDIAIDGTGDVAIAALCDVLVTGNVARGEWIVSSATKFRGKSAGYDKPLYGAVGYALTAYSGGADGSVQAVVMPEPKQLTSAGTSWAVGGNNGAGTSNAQKFTIASATWSTVAGAALGAATYGPGGLGYGTTAGYGIGGFVAATVVTAYKMPFATEVTATQSSANLPAARYIMFSGYNGAAKGYVVGGDNGSTRQSTVTKLTYATDTMSAALGTTLSVARLGAVGISNGTLAYAQGGHSTGFSGLSDMITFATDVVSDNNPGDIAAEIYNGFSFAADSGYMAQKSGATSNSKKIVIATGVSANVTSTLPADQEYATGITDGNGLGWISGDDAAPYSVSSKFTKATETYAADAGAVMSVGKMQAAAFNNGAY